MATCIGASAAPDVVQEVCTVRFTHQKRQACRGRRCLHVSSVDGRITRCLGEVSEDLVDGRIVEEVIKNDGWIEKVNKGRTRMRVLVSWTKPTFEDCLAAIRKMGDDPARRAKLLEELAASEVTE